MQPESALAALLDLPIVSDIACIERLAITNSGSNAHVFHYVRGSKRFGYGEQRFVTLGMLHDIVVVMAHTETAREFRIISMRKATRHEQTLYFQNI